MFIILRNYFFIINNYYIFLFSNFNNFSICPIIEDAKVAARVVRKWDFSHVIDRLIKLLIGWLEMCRSGLGLLHLANMSNISLTSSLKLKAEAQ